MKRYFAGMLLSLIVFSACQKDSTSDVLDERLETVLDQAAQDMGKSFFQLPESDDFANIPQDPKNPLTTAKVQLGKLLFHETALGIEPHNNIAFQTYSCASCHFASAGFQACKNQGIGEGGTGFGINGEARNISLLFDVEDLDVQPIRTPSALNIGFQTNILWNGQFGATHLNEGTESSWEYGTPKVTNLLGYEGTETQAIAGLTVHRQNLNKAWADQLGYTMLFQDAFPGVPDDSLFTKEYAGLAIAAYERTLLATKAPFQLWLKGHYNAMSDKEKRGAIVFFKDANCNSCHTGPALNSMAFYGLGMKDLWQTGAFKTNPQNTENLGRGGFTKRPEDNYHFKVPQLYNLKDSPHYGHGASFNSLRQVVEYKNRAIKENPTVSDAQLSSLFVPQHLTAAQIDDLTAFLTFGLRDPQLHRYQPIHVLSGSCIPNNDPTSKVDLGCQ
jgi:cytochrome c peroxidase